MIFNHLSRPLALRALAPAAVLVSALIATPAIACKNPSLVSSRTAMAGAPEARVKDVLVDDSDLLFGDESVVGDGAEYTLVSGEATGSVIGMWQAVLRIGDSAGPVYDEVFQQFHSDGTEMIVSNGLPPALGNVCVGVWKRTGPGAYKLSHMTWNWLPDDGGFGVPGTFAGHFELQVRLRLNDNGNAYRGTWKATNYDPDGNHIPALDAEGVVTGKRITVD